jgi:hypothetical protein
MIRSRFSALTAAAVLCAAIALPVRADFDDVVRALETKAGGHRQPIPLFGLVRLAIWIAHPDGVHDLEMATWEGTRTVIDGKEVAPLLRSKAGANYRPLVAAHSRRDGEWTYIYARPGRGDLMEIIVLSHDREDTVAIRALIEPRVMAQEFGDRSHHRHGVSFARR